MKAKLEHTPELHLGNIPRSRTFNVWTMLKYSAKGSEKKKKIVFCKRKKNLLSDLHLKSGEAVNQKGLEAFLLCTQDRLTR